VYFILRPKGATIVICDLCVLYSAPEGRHMQSLLYILMYILLRNMQSEYERWTGVCCICTTGVTDAGINGA
jgi:hypothetical protein